MEKLIYAIGIAGQFFFSCRILAQWLASEKANQSVVPLSFWIFSLVGSLLLLTYALLRKDPVFTIGQSLGLIVYLRNIQFLRRKTANESL